MIDRIIALDYRITLAFNCLHSDFLDSVMLFLSSRTVWIPLYAAIAVLMFVPRWYGRKSAASRSDSRIPLWVTGLVGVLAVVLCFGITEQVTNIVKEWVARPRPGHDPALAGLLHLPEGKGGSYGFFSAHASNSFGLAAITSCIFKRKAYTSGIMLWAASVSISRVYLAKHFATDVFCGLCAGILTGLCVYLLYRYAISLISKKY